MMCPKHILLLIICHLEWLWRIHMCAAFSSSFLFFPFDWLWQLDMMMSFSLFAWLSQLEIWSCLFSTSLFITYILLISNQITNLYYYIALLTLRASALPKVGVASLTIRSSSSKSGLLAKGWHCTVHTKSVFLAKNWRLNMMITLFLFFHFVSSSLPDFDGLR